MIQRFSDPDGRVLHAALLEQTLVNGNVDIARRFAAVARVEGHPINHVLVEQGAADNDMYLILSGTCSIRVNGRHIVERYARQHVGEMAVADPKAKRAATVIATEEVVVARITESDFSAIACDYPEIWRQIACELADRLRQRNRLVTPRNMIPQLFIGSSREHLDVAHEVGGQLASDQCNVQVWTDGVFGPSDVTIDALERTASTSDFAVLVLGADDKLEVRGKRHIVARDNVVLELGLFIGALGRERVFMLIERGTDVKVPSDMLGVIPIYYSADASEDLAARLTPACAELRTVIGRRGPK